MASRKQEEYIISRGTAGYSAGMNARTPGATTEMSPCFHAAYQAVPATLSSSADPQRKSTRSNDTVLGEFTNIPTVSGIQAVQNLFGGCSLGTPMFTGKESSTGQSPKFISPRRHSDQRRRISQGGSQSEVDPTHPEPQNTAKPTIPQHTGDTKPDTAPNISEFNPTPGKTTQSPHPILKNIHQSQSA